MFEQAIILAGAAIILAPIALFLGGRLLYKWAKEKEDK